MTVRRGRRGLEAKGDGETHTHTQRDTRAGEKEKCPSMGNYGTTGFSGRKRMSLLMQVERERERERESTQKSGHERRRRQADKACRLVKLAFERGSCSSLSDQIRITIGRYTDAVMHPATSAGENEFSAEREVQSGSASAARHKRYQRKREDFDPREKREKSDDEQETEK